MLSTGQLLAERYQLTRRIAVGGMGEVWQAADTRLDRTVAVKVLKAELSGNAEFLHRFRAEAKTTASLNHPNIAAVHDYGETTEPGASEDDGHQLAYLIMELVEGEPLAAILAREGRISTEYTLDILEQAGHALQAAHERGLVHRDIKPGNILITTNPQGGITVKLTDFGIAKAADAAPVTRSGIVMGTAHYIAPEQALGHDAEPASDVYSLAVCGYECLTGHRPFLSENAVTVAMMHIRNYPPPLPPSVSAGTRTVIEATLVKDPRRRYHTGGEFAQAIAAVRAGHPPPPPTMVIQQRHPVTSLGPPTQPNSYPVLRPVTPSSPRYLPPGVTLTPVTRKRSSAVLWVLLSLLVLAVVLGAIFLIPRMLDSSGATSPDGTGTSDTNPVVTTGKGQPFGILEFQTRPAPQLTQATGPNQPD